MSNAGSEDWKAAILAERDKSMNASELSAHFEEMDKRYADRCLLLHAICRSKAIFAMNGFVIEGAGWMAVSFDEDGLPILTDEIVKALEASR